MFSHGAPLSDWLAWLETLSPTEINLGLERVQCLHARLQLKQPAQRLLIAGTNGKGSSVAMADALLRAAGKRVGAYTSPHVSRYNERIAVDGKTVSDDVIIGAFERVEAVRGDTELTYFEFGTLAAEVIFAEAELDVWILEVGLGGRLDATNAVDPTASLITNVALDHCDWLGHDVESIAVEKAGVMRPRRPTVFGDESVPDAVTRVAGELGARLLLRGRDFDVTPHSAGTWDWRGPSGNFGPLQPPGLAGTFQIGNAAAVLALLDAAGLIDGIDANLINRVLPEVAVNGRCQRLSAGGRHWVLDVAHNPAAAAMLATTLAAEQYDGELLAIVGMLDDKDVAGVLEPLLEHVSSWIAMTPDSHRAIPAAELGRRIANLTDRPCLLAATPADAVEFARRKASENDRILVTGSFFTVGPVLDLLESLAQSQP